MSAVQASWQPSLFGEGEAQPDSSFASLRHHALDETAWLDHAPGWLGGADGLFEEFAGTAIPSAPTSIATAAIRSPGMVIAFHDRLSTRWLPPSHSDTLAASSCAPEGARPSRR